MSIRRQPPLARALSVLALAAVAGLSGSAQEPEAVSRQATTAERLRREPWWPRKPLESTGDLAGSATCGVCHPEILASQRATTMARTLAPAAPSPAVGLDAGGEYSLGPYRYRITGGARGAGFTVGDGSGSKSAPLEWVFGSGETGHTYLWRQDGVFYESRFSYFPGLQDFADTPGRLRGVPDSLAMALGHPLPAKEARGCFSCHASAMTAEPLEPGRLEPGVTCEGCHGPGADHVERETSGLDSAATILDLGDFGPHDALDFCGACHATFWDIEIGPATGLATVRSPGYRLVKSRCWGAGDARLTCTACHDPHEPLAHEPAAYDDACLACHGPAAESAGDGSRDGSPPCPVAAASCVTCHMPDVELPELHVKSTDHWIRVVERTEPSAP